MAVDLPRLSIVTPSLNQGEFLEESMRSVLGQDYPHLEYIVIDGGSTDGSVDTIRRLAAGDARVAWVSERDRGQHDAINKGFARSSGEIMAWINSSDKYCPWAFRQIGTIFAHCPDVRWLTTSTVLGWNADGLVRLCRPVEGYSVRAFYWGFTLEDSPQFLGWIQQEATFWRRELWEAAGGQLDDRLDYAADFDLWARFFEHTDLVTTHAPLAGFRKHPGQKTGPARMAHYYAEAHQVLARYRDRAGRPPTPARRAFLRWLARRTGRGGRRFGQRARSVRYDWKSDQWLIEHRYLI